MATKKRGMTAEQHREFGNDIKQFRDKLLNWLCTHINAAYPKTSKQANAIRGVEKALQTLKCAMDDAACREGHEDATRSYYGGTLGEVAK